MRSADLSSRYASRPIVYVDMDGTLADFFGAVAQAHHVDYWREIHRQDIAIDQVAQKPGFFAKLKPMSNADKLIRGVLQLAGSYSILSSPLQSDVEHSSKEKTAWLERHLKNHQPDSIIFDHEKYKYARQADGTPNILIDDWDANILLWEANGGIGILYQDRKCGHALKKLQRALHGQITPQQPDLAVLDQQPELTEDEPEQRLGKKLFTNRQVLKYVKRIHKDYHLEKPILKFKTWVLKTVPLDQIKMPEYVHQDDPYRRVIDINLDHVLGITRDDIERKPVVLDQDGWVLDGNHRVTAARAAHMDSIRALAPYSK